MQANPPQTNNGPIFIVGYIHTGTSLLNSMLRVTRSLVLSVGDLELDALWAWFVADASCCDRRVFGVELCSDSVSVQSAGDLQCRSRSTERVEDDAMPPCVMPAISPTNSRRRGLLVERRRTMTVRRSRDFAVICLAWIPVTNAVTFDDACGWFPAYGADTFRASCSDAAARQFFREGCEMRFRERLGGDLPHGTGIRTTPISVVAPA